MTIRKFVRRNINEKITKFSSMLSDEKLLKQFCDVAGNTPAEFAFIINRIETKYGFRFIRWHRRKDVVAQFIKLQPTLCVIEGQLPDDPVEDEVVEMITIKKEESKTQSDALKKYYKLREEMKSQLQQEEFAQLREYSI